MEKEAILSVKDLSVSFRMYDTGLEQYDLKVISNLSLDVRPGEIVAIAGSSGSGKSLLAHAVMGLLPQNATISGEISYKGKKGFVPKKRVKISTKAPKLKGSKKTKGKTVASFAKRFVGNPYRWGGTNLNTGADCSGFTKAVYRSFGYNIPRTSSSQRRAGKKVSYKKKQPGDLICYSGHVAIYIGGGKIVHASSRKTGIKISPKANYRKVVSVRRIVR